MGQIRIGAFIAFAALGAAGYAAELRLEIGENRNTADVSARMDAYVRSVSRNLALATEAQRNRLRRIGRWNDAIPFSLPTTLRLTRGGAPLGASTLLRGGGGSLTIAFDASGPRSFPAPYKQLLQDTFAEATSTMNAVFGNPAFVSTIHVRNYDADIGDRDAVAGGYYVPDNGSSEQEIRLPVYANSEAAAVNFVHCLLLAYMGPNGYGFDAFREGLVRAATMRVVRTPGAMPAGLDAGLIESVLENTYDVGTFYDWYNQRGLGGSKFIAPNLRDTQLPPGGSLGGIYLLRYQMSGSAWQKALVEYPAFASALNSELYAQPSLASDVPGLIAKGQQVINALAGSGSATLEGFDFASWFQRQRILETKDTLGLKLVCHPTPLPPISGSDDFGVFDVAATYFETLPGGNEVLLSGTSYPIFWSPTFDRISPSAQEDRMDIAGAYGSVAPNLPNLQGGTPYRAAVDIPVQDRIARVYLPAGGVATGAQTTPNDFYGTVVGANSLGSLKVRLTYGATVVDDIPVTDFAFGATVGTSTFLASNRCRVEVIQTNGANSVTIVDRFVNKGPGPLALDLRVEETAAQTFVGGLPKGLSTVGFGVDPLSNSVSSMLGLPENQILVARWNGAKARFDLYPDTGTFLQGASYFVRLPAAIPGFAAQGRSNGITQTAVAMRPGWNMVANPTTQTIPVANVTVVHAANTPKPFADALGSEIGAVFYEFSAGPNDAATGAPETGTMVPATQFQPGRMYFVRVLVAEGATLLFAPSGPSRPGSGTSGAAPPRYTMKFQIERNGFRSHVVIGQSASATSNFDRKEDAELPPGSFGLQATVEENRLYRDMRRSYDTSTYTIRFDGLQPNATYRLACSYLQGAHLRYKVRRQGTPAWQTFDDPAILTIRPSAATVRYEVKVESR